MQFTVYQPRISEERRLEVEGPDYRNNKAAVEWLNAYRDMICVWDAQDAPKAIRAASEHGLFYKTHVVHVDTDVIPNAGVESAFVATNHPDGAGPGLRVEITHEYMTSLSVGNIVHDSRNDEYLVCLGIGWAVLGDDTVAEFLKAVQQ